MEQTNVEQKLIGILNTATNYAISEDDDTIFKELPPEYKKATFRETIEYIIKENSNELAQEVRNYLVEEDGTSRIFEIRAYSENRELKPNAFNPESNVLLLDECIAPYIEERKLNDGSAYDCIEMLIDLNTKVG